MTVVSGRLSSADAWLFVEPCLCAYFRRAVLILSCHSVAAWVQIGEVHEPHGFRSRAGGLEIFQTLLSVAWFAPDKQCNGMVSSDSWCMGAMDSFTESSKARLHLRGQLYAWGLAAESAPWAGQAARAVAAAEGISRMSKFFQVFIAMRFLD